MEPIWYTVGYTILAGQILCYTIQVLQLLYCVMRYYLDPKFIIAREYRQVCQQHHQKFIFVEIIVLQVQIILSIVAIFSIVWRKSIYMLPWLAFIAVEETYRFLDRSFSDPKKILSISLSMSQQVVIWIVLFKIYKKTLSSEEDELSEYEEYAQRHSFFGVKSNRRGLSFKKSNSS